MFLTSQCYQRLSPRCSSDLSTPVLPENLIYVPVIPVLSKILTVYLCLFEWTRKFNLGAILQQSLSLLVMCSYENQVASCISTLFRALSWMCKHLGSCSSLVLGVTLLSCTQCHPLIISLCWHFMLLPPASFDDPWGTNTFLCLL